jgi:hypothetical protein
MRRTWIAAGLAGIFWIFGCAHAGTTAPEGRGLTAKVEIPADLRAKILADDQHGPWVMHIDGVELPAHKPAVVHVFGNLTGAPPVEEPEKSESYLGYFTIVPKTAQKGTRPDTQTDIVLDVTPNLRKLLQDSSTLTVTLVPAAGVDLRALGMKIGKVSIRPEE